MVWTYVFVGASGLTRLGVLWSRPILASYGMGAKQALTVLNGGGAGHSDTDTEANGAEGCASSAVHVRSKISDSICSQNLWRGLTIWCSVMSMIIHKLVGWHWGTENSGQHHNPGVILSRSPPMFSQSAPSWTCIWMSLYVLHTVDWRGKISPLCRRWRHGGLSKRQPPCRRWRLGRRVCSLLSCVNYERFTHVTLRRSH